MRHDGIDYYVDRFDRWICAAHYAIRATPPDSDLFPGDYMLAIAVQDFALSAWHDLTAAEQAKWLDDHADCCADFLRGLLMESAAWHRGVSS